MKTQSLRVHVWLYMHVHVHCNRAPKNFGTILFACSGNTQLIKRVTISHTFIGMIYMSCTCPIPDLLCSVMYMYKHTHTHTHVHTHTHTHTYTYTYTRTRTHTHAYTATKHGSYLQSCSSATGQATISGPQNDCQHQLSCERLLPQSSLLLHTCTALLGCKGEPLSTTIIHAWPCLYSNPPPRNLTLLPGVFYSGRGSVARKSLRLNESILQSDLSRPVIQQRLRRRETRFPITLLPKISLVRSSQMVESSMSRIEVVEEVGVASKEGVVNEEDVDGDTLIRLNCFFSRYSPFPYN